MFTLLSFGSVLKSIWTFLIHFCGYAVMVTLLISAVMVLAEMIFYHAKNKPDESGKGGEKA